MGTAVLVSASVVIALALLCKLLVAYQSNGRRYGRGEHRIILYSHRGKPLTSYVSLSPGRLHRRRNRALRSRRIGGIEIIYANGRRELTFKLQEARQLL